MARCSGIGSIPEPIQQFSVKEGRGARTGVSATRQQITIGYIGEAVWGKIDIFVENTMLKPVIGGMVGALLYFPPVAAQLQVQSLSPQTLSQASISKESNEAVRQLEIQQFAQALKQLKRIEMETQEKIVAALKHERLSPERFQEIGRQQSNLASAGSEITPSEQERFNKALAAIQTIQQEAAPKEHRAITLQGLTEERFNQIGQIIDKNPALKQQLKNSL